MSSSFEFSPLDVADSLLLPAVVKIYAFSAIMSRRTLLGFNIKDCSAHFSRSFSSLVDDGVPGEQQSSFVDWNLGRDFDVRAVPVEWSSPRRALWVSYLNPGDSAAQR